MIDLHPYRCANPDCPSRRTGRGQILMRGETRVNWRGEGLCSHCKHFTMVEVTPTGIRYIVRPSVKILPAMDSIAYSRSVESR